MGSREQAQLVVSGIAAITPRRPSDATETAASSGAQDLAPSRWAGAPARLGRMDRLCALALVACDGALVDAAIDPRETIFSGKDTAVIFGTAFGCHATNADYYQSFLQAGLASASPRLFAYTLPSSPVGEITIHYNVTGPATALAQGLTAGLDAVLDGMRQIERGRAERSLVIAADVATPLLSRLLMAEGLDGHVEDGSAALVIEPASIASARGHAARGRILAITSCFAAGERVTAIRDAVQGTLAAANVAADRIEVVYGPAADRDAIDLRGIAQHDIAPSTLAAAPLHNLQHFFAAETGPRLGLVAIGDPEGTACVALVERLG